MTWQFPLMHDLKINQGARKEQSMKSSKFGKVFFAILMVCLFVSANSYAQTGTTSLRGTVIDKTGASVGDAKVSLDNLGQAFHREAQTSTTGEYDFVAL